MEVDAELRRARQLVRHFATLELAVAQPGDRIGQPYVPVQSPIAETTAKSPIAPSSTSATVAASTALSAGDAWTAAPLWMGAGLLTLGLGFLAWSVLQQQADWWQPGLPLTILGQASLTLGLLLRPRNLSRS